MKTKYKGDPGLDGSFAFTATRMRSGLDDKTLLIS